MIIPPPNSAPLVTVVVPVYNVEEYLEQCTESILGQTLRDYELWLIDDGSSDSSIDIIKRYAARDARIRTAFIKGHGPSIPRNYGLRRARGKYIYFVDSDDYLSRPDALEELVGIMEANPGLQMLRSNQWIDIKGRGEVKTVLAPRRQHWAGKIIPGEEMLEVLDGDFTPQNTMLSLQFLRENGLEFNEEMSMLEDVVWTNRILACASACMWHERETYSYRLANPTSITNSPKNLKKILSLAYIPGQLAPLAASFGFQGRARIERECVRYAQTSLFSACANLKGSERREVYEYLKTNYPRLPVVDTDLTHRLALKAWNVHPGLAYAAVRLLHRFLGHK